MAIKFMQKVNLHHFCSAATVVNFLLHFKVQYTVIDCASRRFGGGGGGISILANHMFSREL